jgi:hypothetical protein
MTVWDAIRYGASGLAGVLLTAFIGANVRSLAAAKGWDNLLLRAWDWVADRVRTYLPGLNRFLAMVWRGKWWFWLTLGLSSGIAISLWLVSLSPPPSPEDASLRAEVRQLQAALDKTTRERDDAKRNAGRQERIIVDTTPQKLMDFYKGRTGLEAQRLIAPYIGKWIKVNDNISSTQQTGHEILVTFQSPFSAVFLNFDFKWLDRLSVLPPNAKISAFCAIADVGSSGTKLTHCELD